MKAIILISLFAVTIAQYSPLQSLSTRDSNTSLNRSSWGDFDINTPFSTEWPSTNKTRYYELTISNKWIAPDGFPVLGMVFNDQFPGPLIEADWGDTLNIKVYNNLSNYNGTAVHWHGIRQLNTNWQDGVPGVTQCPITPLHEQIYEFQVTQYGSSWYHSHFALQYPAGLYGPLKINGPTSMNYDVVMDPWLVSDWYHENPFSLFYVDLGPNAPPKVMSTLLQGQGRFCSDAPANSNCTGSYWETTFIQNTTYKLSIVNAGTQSQQTFWIDGHSFWVVSTDFVPIEPFWADTLNIAIGQRYDLIVTANASFTHGTDFWTHFLARTDSCTTTNISSTLGIIRYDNASITLPYTPIDDRQNFGCAEPPLASLAPVVKEAVGNPINGITPAQYLNISLRGYPDVNNGSSYLNKWLLQRQSMVINWSVPTLSLLTSTNSTDGSNFPPSTVPIFLPYEQGDWVYFLIEGNFTPTDPATIHTVPSGHPMHLHGHDFRILDQKDVPFDIETFTPDLDNPPKRDTAMVPQGGYLMIAFQMDNPGAWLMHCHIAFHASSGMAVQFVESPAKFLELARDAGIAGGMKDQCNEWTAFYDNYNIPFHDTQGLESGI